MLDIKIGPAITPLVQDSREQDFDWMLLGATARILQGKSRPGSADVSAIIESKVRTIRFMSDEWIHNVVLVWYEHVEEQQFRHGAVVGC